MGLSTHVLDTMHGCPAAGMQVALYTTSGEVANLVRRFTLDRDGRNPDGPLYDEHSLKKGTYRLVFDVAGYFRARGVELPEPNFLNKVSLDFGVAHTDQHYHSNLLGQLLDSTLSGAESGCCKVGCELKWRKRDFILREITTDLLVSDGGEAELKMSIFRVFGPAHIEPRCPKFLFSVNGRLGKIALPSNTFYTLISI